MDYGHSSVYPWENKISESQSEVSFAWVADYVYDHDAHGEKLMPYLRMGVDTPDGHQTVILTEKGARDVIAELTNWLDRPKRLPRRRRLLPQKYED